MMELNIQKQVGNYLSKLMDMELTGHLDRKPYQRAEETGKPKNYRNGSYDRKFFIKNIGEIATKIPRDRNNEFRTKVLPKESIGKEIKDKTGGFVICQSLWMITT